MRVFSLTKKAKFDLKTIATYTQRKWGKEQRRIYTLQFDKAFHTLAKTPEIGINCSFIKQGYRKFPVNSHLIFYQKINQDEIEIIRILHKRMDVETQITSP